MLRQDIACALELAEQGHVETGYRILDHALSEAEALPDHWAADLAALYRKALVLFAQAHRYHFPLPGDFAEAFPPPPLERAQILAAASGRLLSNSRHLQAQASSLCAEARALRGRCRQLRRSGSLF